MHYYLFIYTFSSFQEEIIHIIYQQKQVSQFQFLFLQLEEGAKRGNLLLDNQQLKQSLTRRVEYPCKCRIQLESVFDCSSLWSDKGYQLSFWILTLGETQWGEHNCSGRVPLANMFLDQLAQLTGQHCSVLNTGFYITVSFLCNPLIASQSQT